MRLRKDYLNERMQDDAFRAAYEEIAPEFDVADALLTFRKKERITQAELAKRIGINRSDLSKLESAMANPTLKTLKKIASAIGQKLIIKYESNHISLDEPGNRQKATIMFLPVNRSNEEVVTSQYSMRLKDMSHSYVFEEDNDGYRDALA